MPPLYEFPQTSSYMARQIIEACQPDPNTHKRPAALQNLHFLLGYLDECEAAYRGQPVGVCDVYIETLRGAWTELTRYLQGVSSINPLAARALAIFGSEHLDMLVKGLPD